jgi:ParB family chromosome partitioning protein
VITEGHARQILSLKGDEERQQELLGLIMKHEWSVRQAERFVISIKEGFAETKDAAKRVATDTPETKRLTKRYKAPVQIRRTAHGGRVEIAFSSDDDLARILNELER